MEAENVNSVEKVKFVTKRNGQRDAVDTKQIKERLEKLTFELDKKYINLDLIVEKVIQGMHDGITTAELDNLAAETCAYMNIIHPQYSLLAARVAVDNLHKETNENFFEAIEVLHSYIDKAGNNIFFLCLIFY